MGHILEHEKFSKKKRNPMNREWFGVEPFSIIQGRVHVVHAHYGISPFTSRLHWSKHRFCIRGFFIEVDYDS